VEGGLRLAGEGGVADRPLDVLGVLGALDEREVEALGPRRLARGDEEDVELHGAAAHLALDHRDERRLAGGVAAGLVVHRADARPRRRRRRLRLGRLRGGGHRRGRRLARAAGAAALRARRRHHRAWGSRRRRALVGAGADDHQVRHVVGVGARRPRARVGVGLDDDLGLVEAVAAHLRREGRRARRRERGMVDGARERRRRAGCLRRRGWVARAHRRVEQPVTVELDRHRGHAVLRDGRGRRRRLRVGQHLRGREDNVGGG